ncbi:hypothetical protein H6G81_32275 [Scytonema hofmannii FACHB-248]|uniref:Uncharacterized protein n=1 Tax=Scytonema hofmannii FACHB-248 TaxID=1842502 RepID=A0ABR8H0U3_9CYAN|nr:MULTISPECIES: hypothetical protein [Nostocales]MBD2609069.1 hypothetical protein [Scytonema hofmannii FACHB-248]
MTKTTLNTQNPEIKRNYIIEILEQLTVDYQNTKQERKEVAALDPNFEEEFTVLEEIELLTVDIRGYASQIKRRGWIENEQQAINQLKSMRLFDIPAIAQFYLTTGREYRQIKAYMQMLDYLRLLIIEYLQPNQHSEPGSV